MNKTIIIPLELDEFKALLKEILKEVLNENMSESKSALPEILSINEAAFFLNCAVASLYEKTSKRQIPHAKKGNRLYFHRSELEQWLKSGKVKTTAEIEMAATTYLLTSKKR